MVGVHTSSKLWKLAPVAASAGAAAAAAARGEPQVVSPATATSGVRGVVAVMPRLAARGARPHVSRRDRPHSQIDHVLVRDDIEVLVGRSARRDAVGSPSDPSPAAADASRPVSRRPGNVGAVGYLGRHARARRTRSACCAGARVVRPALRSSSASGGSSPTASCSSG